MTNVISRLEKLGFSLTLEGEKIRYKGAVVDAAAPLLVELKANKADAIKFLKERQSVVGNDPGVDVSPVDSPLWVRLLAAAKKIDNDFAARLLYLRGGGCRLVSNERTGFRLEPIIDETGCNGWISQQVYDVEKQCLWPYKEKLVDLLKELKEVQAA